MNQDLEFAIKNRIDLFELIRSSSLDEYNRTNPLYPLDIKSYNHFKEIIKKVEQSNGTDS